MRVAAGKTWRIRGHVERLWLGEKTVDARLAETNLFFLLGSGRCGTLFVSTLLNLDPAAVVRHEPRGHPDLDSRPRSRRDPEFARVFLERIVEEWENRPIEMPTVSPSITP